MDQRTAISNYNALNGKTITVAKLAAVGADLKSSLAEGGVLWIKIKAAHNKIERVVKSLKPTERIEVELTPITIPEKKVVEKSPKVKRESKSPKPVKERKTSTKSSAGNFKPKPDAKKKVVVKKLPVASKPVASIQKPVPSIQRKHGLGATELSKLTGKEIAIDGHYKEVLVRLYSDTQFMIWGMPGHGKTVWILLFAKYLSQQKGLNVLVVENEEFGRSSFGEKLIEFQIPNIPNLTFTKKIPDDVSMYDAIFLDSINSLGFNVLDYRNFVESNPGKIYIPIVQSTKDGGFRGGQDWEHEVDIAGEIKHRELVLRKNRFDPDLHKKRETIVMDDMVQEKKKHHTIKETVKEQLQREQQAEQDPYGFDYSNLGHVTIR